MNSLVATPAFGQGGSLRHRAWWHARDHFVPHARNNFQPHLLHHRTLTVLSLLLITAKIVGLSAVEFAQPTGVDASQITQSSVLELTNQSRVSAGLPALGYSTVLERVAQKKAEDMASRQYFSHTTPDGKTPWSFFESVGYAYQSAGENLAVHFMDVEPLQDAWMNSPGHRANILSSKFTEMGVGMAKGMFEGYESMFVVEAFGLPAVQKQPEVYKQASAALAPAPTSVQAQAVQKQPSTWKPAPAMAKAAEEKLVEVLPTPAQDFTISAVDIRPTDNSEFYISVAAPTTAAKVWLTYGQASTLLVPTSSGEWVGTVPAEKLRGVPVLVRAMHLDGREALYQVGTLEPSFAAGHQAVVGEVHAANITVLGQKVSLGGIENKIYLAVIALLLTALIIGIAVHRHMQHLQLIANTSFVVFFAALLLVL